MNKITVKINYRKKSEGALRAPNATLPVLALFPTLIESFYLNRPNSISKKNKSYKNPHSI